MDKPRGPKKCLSIASGSPPRHIPRPDRYEVDDTPLSPPGSNYLLFDSSKIFTSHPHKYRLLIKKNGSKDDLPSPGPSRVDDAAKPLGQRRSKSLVSLPSLDTDSPSTGIDSSATSHPKQDYGGGATARDERELEQFLSSKHLSRPRSSADSLVLDIGANLGDSYLSTYGQHSHKKEAVGGIDKLSRNFHDTVALREREPVSFQIQPFEETEDSMSSETKGTATPERKSSVPPPSEDASAAEPKYVVKEVQPEPRRLFGFGPFYHPLPEVVVEKQHPQPPLTERIRKEGITARGADTLDAPSAGPHRKTSTGKETSMWMPFSF